MIIILYDRLLLLDYIIIHQNRWLPVGPDFGRLWYIFGRAYFYSYGA